MKCPICNSNLYKTYNTNYYWYCEWCDENWLFEIGQKVYVIRKFSKDIVEATIKKVFYGRLDNVLRYRLYCEKNTIVRKEYEIYLTYEHALEAKNGA